jgi:hypothetical protein
MEVFNMHEYTFKEIMKRENLNKKYFKRFKKYHNLNKTYLGKEMALIELMGLMDKTNIEPFATASFERNLVRSIKSIKDSNDTEKTLGEWANTLKVIGKNPKCKIKSFFTFNIIQLVTILISLSTLFLSYCRLVGIQDPINWLISKF